MPVTKAEILAFSLFVAFIVVFFYFAGRGRGLREGELKALRIAVQQYQTERQHVPE